jgi:uncharacterized protein YjbJ (UPF0337 family)
MEAQMSSTSDKAKGYANKAAGAVKEKVGQATGNEELEAKGDLQQAKGSAQVGLGKAKDAAKEGAKAARKAFD